MFKPNHDIAKLTDIAIVIMGQSPASADCNGTSIGLPLLNGPTEFGPHHPTPVQFTTDAKRIAEKGDLLFCVRGSTTGRMNWADRRYAIGRGLASIRSKDGPQSSPFVRAVIEYKLDELLKAATGSTFPNVSREQLGGMPIPLPPLPEQRRIAKILGDLDDKIELNRKMNETLEQMARALFKSWFVDFDPVRAKMEGRTPTGMDAATAALFPDRLVDSELGPIPEGWEVGVLDELTRIVIGGDWGATEPTDIQNVACFCVRGADIPSLQEGGMGKMPTRYLRPSSIAQRQLFDGDLVIEISGGSPTQSTGRPVLVSDALLQVLQRPIVASNFCRIVKLKKTEYSKYIYYWLRSLYDAGALFQYENGTTGIKNFAFTLFSASHHLLIPNSCIALSFNTAVSSLLKAIQHNANQSRTLSTLRDALLPKLVGGEVRV